MIDALEVLVPPHVARRLAIWKKFHDKRKRLHGNLHYSLVFDFRPDLPARVYVGEKRRSGVRHAQPKVEFKDLLSLTADDLVCIVKQLFVLDCVQAQDLKVSRVDFAVDVNIPVDWFRTHARVLHKQVTTEYPRNSAKRGIATLQFGKRPDLYRIYDKIEQLRTKKKSSRPPIFVKRPLPFIGRGEGGTTVTRLERQCTNPKIPPSLNRLGKLIRNAADFDPFEKIALSVGADSFDINQLKPKDWLMALGLRTAITEHGYRNVRAKLDGGRNAARIFRAYSQYLGGTENGLTREKLRESYRRTTSKQLGQGLNPLYRTFFPLLCNTNEPTSI